MILFTFFLLDNKIQIKVLLKYSKIEKNFFSCAFKYYLPKGGFGCLILDFII